MISYHAEYTQGTPLQAVQSIQVLEADNWKDAIREAKRSGLDSVYSRSSNGVKRIWCSYAEIPPTKRAGRPSKPREHRKHSITLGLSFEVINWLRSVHRLDRGDFVNEILRLAMLSRLKEKNPLD